MAIAGEMALVLANLKADYNFDVNYSVVKTDSILPWAATTAYKDLPRDKRRANSTVFGVSP